MNSFLYATCPRTTTVTPPPFPPPLTNLEGVFERAVQLLQVHQERPDVQTHSAGAHLVLADLQLYRVPADGRRGERRVGEQETHWDWG